MTFLFTLAQFLLIPALSPLFVGVVRKIKARFQNRVDAGVFQSYRDILKLFTKDEVISHDASWIFMFAPYLIFGVTLVIGWSIPVFSSFFENPMSDLITLVYLLALATFFLALAGLDTGSTFGGFGSSREMTLAALTEAGLLFSLLVPAFLSQTSDLFLIAERLAELPFAAFAPVLIAFGAFFIALLSETARFPFDNPATHLELTMVHEAMILEYSGKRLALIEWAAANKFLIFLTLGANLFFPWGLAADLSLKGFIFALLTYGLKIFAFCAVIAVLESTIAKLRFFRLPDLLFTSFILGVIALIIVL